MYQCHVQFYLLSQRCSVFEIIKKMPPLERFTHEFLESEQPVEALAAQADVILADFEMLGLTGIQTLISAKSRKAQLILLAEKHQMECLNDVTPDLMDIWICPMSEEEVRFRFLRWQQDNDGYSKR